MLIDGHELIDGRLGIFRRFFVEIFVRSSSRQGVDIPDDVIRRFSFKVLRRIFSMLFASGFSNAQLFLLQIVSLFDLDVQVSAFVPANRYPTAVILRRTPGGDGGTAPRRRGRRRLPVWILGRQCGTSNTNGRYRDQRGWVVG